MNTSYRKTPEDLNMLEIKLQHEDDFLKIKETLTRIGIASFKKKILYQSCHILHKRGLYYVAHFKEIFELDGRDSDMFLEDVQRRNLIAKLLVDWGLCTAVGFDIHELDIGDAITKTKILKYGERDLWTLEQKHSIGKH